MTGAGQRRLFDARNSNRRQTNQTGSWNHCEKIGVNRRSGGSALAHIARSRLNVVLQTHFLDEPELLFDEVDVIFFALLNLHQ